MEDTRFYKGVESHTISKEEMDKFIQGLVDSQSKNGSDGGDTPMSDFIQNLMQGLMDLQANPVVNPMKPEGAPDVREVPKGISQNPGYIPMNPMVQMGVMDDTNYNKAFDIPQKSSLGPEPYYGRDYQYKT